MRKVRAVLLLIVLVAVCTAGFGALLPAGASAADTSQQVRYDRFDVDFAIDASGNVRVTERQDIAFLAGPFRRTSRSIGLSRVEDIKDIAVSESGRSYSLTQSTSQQAGTYTVQRSASALKIEWYFTPTTAQRRIFEVAYTVVGGLRINPDVDVLDWAALRDDLAADVAASTVTVKLPQAVDPGQITLDSRGAAAQRTVVNGSTAQFAATGSVPRGTGLEIKVSFPHGLVSAQPPAWQAAFQRDQAAQERRAALNNLFTLIFCTLGLVLLIGGALGLYAFWYMRGRDRQVGLVAEYLREPPSEISPGVAGTLIDERADLQDVLATFADLGRKGVIRMTEVQTPGVPGFGGGRDYTVERLDATVPLGPFEQTLFRALFPGDEREARMSQLKGRLIAMLPQFADDLYAEVVERSYFKESPEKTRRFYRRAGTTIIIAAIALTIPLIFVFSIPPSIIFLALVVIVLGLALRILARAMPVKTPLGAEEAAKWNAFKRYLANLEKYDNVGEAKGIFERFLPYATAFGLDKGFIQKFASVDTPVPAWYGGGGPIIINQGGYYGGPYYGGPGSYGGGYSGGGGPAPGGDSGGGWHIPSLQDLSDRGGGGLQSWSDNLGDMLSSASSVFGGGGGGGDSGWSGGGGGGGDSGGGSDFG